MMKRMNSELQERALWTMLDVSKDYFNKEFASFTVASLNH